MSFTWAQIRTPAERIEIPKRGRLEHLASVWLQLAESE
jgi:hypothetical protein